MQLNWRIFCFLKLGALILINFYGVQAVNAQSSKHTETVVEGKYTIPVYNFPAFEERMYPEKGNDTLYVFNFWATWCAPCIKELPNFEQVGKELSAQKVKVILVSLDFKSKIKSQLIPFLQKKQIASEVVVLSDPDANSWIDKVSSAWSGAIPATLLVQNDRRAFYEKDFTYEELTSLITKFLNQ